MKTGLEYAELIAYSTKETLYFSYEMAVKFKDVEGVYVECGVAAGAQIIAMACGAPRKTIYAFDSFEGIPLPSNRDDQYPGIRRFKTGEQEQQPAPGWQTLESTGATAVNEDVFESHLIGSGVGTENIVTIKGWFENILPEFSGIPVPIAILRLDGDLYNSTFVSLKYLFPMVIEGGVVIVDDWELLGCREACKDYFFSIGYKPKYQFISNISYFFK